MAKRSAIVRHLPKYCILYIYIDGLLAYSPCCRAALVSTHRAVMSDAGMVLRISKESVSAGYGALTAMKLLLAFKLHSNRNWIRDDVEYRRSLLRNLK